MRHFAYSILLLTAATAGCQSPGSTPVPAIDPFAMYGHTRIAPPSTGSYGSANRNPYYSGNAQADTGDTGEMLAAGESQAAQAFSLVDATKPAAPQASVASYEAPPAEPLSTAIASQESPIRIVERVGSVSSSNTELRGMELVDATNSTPQLASQTNSAVPQAASSQAAQFQAAEGATTIRVLPSSESNERPLPVRGFSAPSATEPTSIPLPAPSSMQPSATIQAGRFIPLEIATSRTQVPRRETIVAASGN